MPISGAGRSAQIEIRADFSRIRRAFNEAGLRLRSMREPLKRSVDYMTKTVVAQRFRAGGIPRWKAHSPATTQRHGVHSLLVLTGRLLESVTGNANSFAYYHTTGNNQHVIFGSLLDYAGVHDQKRGTVTYAGRGGNTPIPGRPWSEITQRNVDKMRDILVIWAQSKLRHSGF